MRHADLIAKARRGIGTSAGRAAQVHGYHMLANLLADALEKMDSRDPREVREMLRAMQAGELTVSRGVELLDMWLAGNYTDEQLPPVRQDLIEEDSMPVEIIDRLKAELVEVVAAEREACANLCEARSDDVMAHNRMVSAYVMGAECAAAIRMRSNAEIRGGEGADALRLSAKLCIDVLHRFVGGQRVEALAPGGPVIIEYCDADTREAATRTAIVRAAALLTPNAGIHRAAEGRPVE